MTEQNDLYELRDAVINEEEIWKDIPDYEGLYIVNNYGVVISLSRCIIRSNGRKQTIKEKIITPKVSSDGYLTIRLNKMGIRKSFTAHQIVAMAFLNHTPCGLKRVVNHKNFNKKDNRVENLEIISNRENCNRKHLPSASKYVGVSKSGEKWQSQIVFNGKTIYLGVFDTEESASRWYEKALKAINNNKEIPIKKASFSSVYKGIYFSKSRNKWRAYIVKNKKYKCVGSFKTEKDAYIAQKNYTEGEE